MLDWTTVVEMLPYMPGTHSAQSVKWQGKNHRQIFKLTIKIFWLQNDVASDTVCLCGLTVKCPQYNYSVIFSRWRQFAPHLLHGSLGISVGSAIFRRPYCRSRKTNPNPNSNIAGPTRVRRRLSTRHCGGAGDNLAKTDSSPLNAWPL